MQKRVAELKEIIKDNGVQQLLIDALKERDLDELKSIYEAGAVGMESNPGDGQFESRVNGKDLETFFRHIDQGETANLSTWWDGIAEVYYRSAKDGTIRVRPHTTAGDRKQFTELFGLEYSDNGAVLMQAEDLKKPE